VTFPTTTKKAWFNNQNCKLSPNGIKTTNRLLSGNAFDNYTLHKMHLVNNNICDAYQLIQHENIVAYQHINNFLNVFEIII